MKNKSIIRNLLSSFFAISMLLIGFLPLPVHAVDLIEGEIIGNPSASCSLSNRSGSYKSTSGGSTCYVDVENAVDYILVYCTGSSSTNCSRGSGSWNVTATFNGKTGSPSGGMIRLEIGSTPVSGTLTIKLSCSAGLDCDSGDSASASCSVTSVKYKTIAKPSFTNPNSILTFFLPPHFINTYRHIFQFL